MTINNREKFNESCPDWVMLKGCFGGGSIKPEDIDGHIERGGVSLFLEHKLPGVKLKVAADIAFDALRKQGNTVVVFWGQSQDGADITHMQVYWPPGNPKFENFPKKKEATLSKLREVCIWWFQHCPEPKRRYS